MGDFTLDEVRTLDRHGASVYMAEVAALTKRSAKPKNIVDMLGRDLHVEGGTDLHDIRDVTLKAAEKAEANARAAGKPEAECVAAGKPADIRLYLNEARNRFVQKFKEARAGKGAGGANDVVLSDTDHRDINSILRYKYLAYVTITPEPGATPQTIFCFYRGRTAKYADDVTDLRNFYPVPLDCLDVFHAGINYTEFIGLGSDIPLHTKMFGTGVNDKNVSFPLYDPRFIVNKWRVTASGKKFLASVKALAEAAATRAPAEKEKKPRKRSSSSSAKSETAGGAPVTPAVPDVSAPESESSVSSDSSSSVSSDSSSSDSSSGSSSSDSSDSSDEAPPVPEPESKKNKKKEKSKGSKDKAPPPKKSKKERKKAAKEAAKSQKGKHKEEAPTSDDPKEAKRLAKNARERAARAKKKAEQSAAKGNTDTDAPAPAPTTAPAAPAPVVAPVSVPPAVAPPTVAPPREPVYGVPKEVAEKYYGVRPLTSEETTTNVVWTDLVEQTGHRFTPSVREVHQLMANANKSAGKPTLPGDAQPWTTSAWVRFIITTLGAPSQYTAMQPWLDQAARGATDTPTLGSIELERIAQAYSGDIFARMQHQVFLTANAHLGLRHVHKRNMELGAGEY